MRTDTELLDWLLPICTAEDGPETGARLKRLAGALMLGMTGRLAVAAAMGAELVEVGEPLPPEDGAMAIARERARQIEVEGFSAEGDDRTNGRGELALAAMVYASPTAGVSPYRDKFRYLWPWPHHWLKEGDRLDELRKAGALIAAEYDRIVRARIDASDSVVPKP